MSKQKNFNALKSKQGFTLVELLVVIAIIGILSSLVLPGIRNAMIKARMLQCKNNLRALYTAMLDYAGDYDAYPSSKGKEFWEDLRRLPDEKRAPLAKQHDFFICPLKRSSTKGIGTCHYNGPDYDVTDAIPGYYPLGWDEPGNHLERKHHVLYFNGQIEAVDAKSFQDTIAIEKTDD